MKIKRSSRGSKFNSKKYEIITVKNVDEVLKIALTKNLKRVEWVEVEQLSKSKSKEETKSTH